mgnify:CR=1 FL=1|jgi:hypothetical protein
MPRKLILISSLVFMLITSVVARAQDVPTDPVDNLCDAGQAWDDGRCDIPGHEGATALAWECGYYMARVLDGRLDASAVPTQCAHLVRGLSEICRLIDELEGVRIVACIRSDQTGSVYLDFSGIPPEDIPSEFPFTGRMSLIEVRFVSFDPLVMNPCPVVPGYEIENLFPAGFFGIFTAEERASLGLRELMCIYMNELVSSRT